MSRKVIIVGHVDHAHCSAIAVELGMERGVKIINVETKEDLHKITGTDCSVLFHEPVNKIDLDIIKVPIVETFTETKRKGHERPYKYHR